MATVRTKLLIVACNCDEMTYPLEFYTEAGLKKIFGKRCVDCGCPIEYATTTMVREEQATPVYISGITD